MKYIDMLVFKTPSQIDWAATNKLIADFVNKSDGSPSEKAMTTDYYIRATLAFVRKNGTKNLYEYKRIMPEVLFFNPSTITKKEESK